jgi:hypothetical protein
MKLESYFNNKGSIPFFHLFYITLEITKLCILIIKLKIKITVK